MTDHTDIGTPARHGHKDAEGRPILRREETMQAGVKPARATTVVERLYRDGLLDHRHLSAATQLQAVHAQRETGTLVSPAYDGVPTAKTRFSGSVPERAIEAGAQWSLTMQRVPAKCQPVLVAIVCEDLTPTEYARRVGWPLPRGRYRAEERLVVALEELVDAVSVRGRAA